MQFGRKVNTFSEGIRQKDRRQAPPVFIPQKSPRSAPSAREGPRRSAMTGSRCDERRSFAVDVGVEHLALCNVSVDAQRTDARHHRKDLFLFHFPSRLDGDHAVRRTHGTRHNAPRAGHLRFGVFLPARTKVPRNGHAVRRRYRRQFAPARTFDAHQFTLQITPPAPR